jgi:hypothetical protein
MPLKRKRDSFDESSPPPKKPKLPDYQTMHFILNNWDNILCNICAQDTQENQLAFETVEKIAFYCTHEGKTRALANAVQFDGNGLIVKYLSGLDFVTPFEWKYSKTVLCKGTQKMLRLLHLPRHKIEWMIVRDHFGAFYDHGYILDPDFMELLLRTFEIPVDYSIHVGGRCYEYLLDLARNRLDLIERLLHLGANVNVRWYYEDAWRCNDTYFGKQIMAGNWDIVETVLLYSQHEIDPRYIRENYVLALIKGNTYRQVLFIRRVPEMRDLLSDEEMVLVNQEMRTQMNSFGAIMQGIVFIAQPICDIIWAYI